MTLIIFLPRCATGRDNNIGQIIDHPVILTCNKDVRAVSATVDGREKTLIINI